MTMTVKPEVQTAQSPFELEMLLTVFDQIDPSSVLELGVWWGGTLWHWLAPGRNVVAVDATMFDADRWQDWADAVYADLTLLHGSTSDPQIVEQAAGLGPYEFVFVDAGHTASEVRCDWTNYRGMVTSGGVMCFHDIQPRDGYGVSEVWDEIKNEPGARTLEILHRGPYEAPDLTAGYDPGVGIVWL